MKRKILSILILLGVLLTACGPTTTPEPPRETDLVETQRQQTEAQSEEARIAASLYGYAVEVWNLAERVKRTNDPSHIQYVYFISPYTGTILFQATAIGKVTSTTKRLEPPQSYELSETHDCGEYDCNEWLLFERIQPDGAYGSSTEGLVWFDTAGLMYEAKVEGVFILTLERPYVFADNKIDLTVDIRLQSSQIDPRRDALGRCVSEYIKTHSDWRPGMEIPLDVLTACE